MRAAGAEPPAPEELADDFVRVACDTMARAVKRISTQRGHDIRGHTLCCFGGAAGQHACLVADALGVQRVLVHPLAGVLSAYGMGLADVRALRERTVELPLDEAVAAAAEAALDELASAAANELAAQGFAAGDVVVRRRAHVKYEGTDVALDVPWGPPREAADAFLALHQRRYGFLMSGRGLVLATLAVEAVGPGAADAAPDVAGPADAGGGSAAAPVTVPAYMARTWHETPVYERAALTRGARLAGPVIVREPTSTTVVEPGWEAELLTGGELLLRRGSPPAPPPADLSRRSPLLLEVFNNRFMSIAEQMGATLANTASSVNIKERLDFSCAVFDAEGGLVANAPHLPVHLGSMGASVQAVIARHGGAFAPGDAFLLNSPYAGGTHLPDLTVVTPVFAGAARPRFFVAARAHHADVGGVTPGSMPPGSTTIAEEGVLVEDFRLVAGGRLREAEVAELLTSAPFPVRDLAQNLADLRAQVAANARGAAELERVVAEFGPEVVAAYMGHVQDNAEEAVRRALGRLTRRLLAPGARRRRRDRRAGDHRRGLAQRRHRLRRHLPAAAPTTSTPRRRCARRRSCTSSAPWWTPTSRSTPAA